MLKGGVWGRKGGCEAVVGSGDCEGALFTKVYDELKSQGVGKRIFLALALKLALQPKGNCYICNSHSQKFLLYKFLLYQDEMNF